MAKKPTKKAVAEVQAAVQSTGNLNVSSVVAQIGSLQVDVQTTLANLSATITGKIQEVEQIDTAIVAKREQLQELYDIEKEALSIEDIKSQRELAQKEAAEEELARQKQTEEEAEDRKTQWARDEEQHTYYVNRRNKTAADDYSSLVSCHQREEAIRQETLKRNWEERENVLKLQETEVARLKDQAASFDARVKAESDKVVAIATATLKRAHEQELILLKKDAETAEKLSQAQVQSLNNTISSLSDQLDSLKEQLESSRKDAKEVVQKTLDAQSKGEAFAALKQAMEAQNQGSKK